MKNFLNLMDYINKDLLPMKGHYFLFNAGTGPVQPFLSIYARELGFSSVVIGVIFTILPIVSMLSQPILGAIADRFRCQKAIFLALQLLIGAAFLTINFAPGIPKEQKVHFNCNNSATNFDTSTNKNDYIDDCLISTLRDFSEHIDCQLSCNMQKSDWKHAQQYWNVTELGSTFNFTAHVIKSNVLSLNGVIYFPFINMTIGQTFSEAVCSNGSISTICEINCNTDAVNSLVSKSSVPDEDVYGLHQFWVFLLLMIIAYSGQSVASAIADAICFELLGDKYDRYGYQRMFGSLGWGIFSAIAGFMVDSLSSNSSSKNYESAFYMAVAFLIVDFAVSSRLKYVQRKRSVNIVKDVGKLLIDVRVSIFLFCCIAVGMCTALLWNFLFFLIEDLARAQGCDSQSWVKTLEGLAMAIQTLLGEMPFFFLSGKILKKIGHVNAMSVVLLILGVRLVAYSVISNPWWFLPIQLLNGLTFGLFYACMASYASIVAPAGTEATMQGLVGAVFEGVGVSLGSLAAGVSYSKLKGPWTFRIFGICIFIVGLLHVLFQYFMKDKSQQQRKKSEAYRMSSTNEAKISLMMKKDVS